MDVVTVKQANPEGEFGVLESSDGNLISAASDYARFMRMILNKGLAEDGGRLLDEASVATLQGFEMRVYRHLRQASQEMALPRAVASWRTT